MTTHKDKPHEAHCLAAFCGTCTCTGTRWFNNGHRRNDAIAIQGIATFFSRLQPDLSAQLSEAHVKETHNRTVIAELESYADRLSTQLSEAQARLAEIGAQKPVTPAADQCVTCRQKAELLDMMADMNIAATGGKGGAE